MTAPRKILALAPLAALALATSPARAQAPAPAPPRELGAHLDADLDLGVPMGYVESRLSFGAGGRLGWRFDLGPVWLQPEAGGHYTVFTRWSPDLPCDDCKHRLTEHPVRVLGGLRLGGAGLIAGVIEPALFGHAGYGWDRSGTPSIVTADGLTTLPRIVDRRGTGLRRGVRLRRQDRSLPPLRPARRVQRRDRQPAELPPGAVPGRRAVAQLRAPRRRRPVRRGPAPAPEASGGRTGSGPPLCQRRVRQLPLEICVAIAR